jgi:hypothetical protein
VNVEDRVWALLGIAPTDDQRAIRVAYSAKLRDIDPGSDPQAFIVLREAFEAVRSGKPDHIAALSSDNPAPIESIAAEASESPLSTLAKLLHSGRHKRGRAALATPDQAREMAELWRAVVNDPQMERVSYYHQVEQQIIVLILECAPLSDPLVDRSISFFGWLKTSEDAAQPATVAAILHRQRLLILIDQLEAGHDLQRAWRELTTPVSGTPVRGTVYRGFVEELLGLAQTDYPGLEQYFDPARVALWDVDEPGPRLSHAQRRRRMGAIMWSIILAGLGFVVFAAVMANKESAQQHSVSGSHP